jgi:hypothetical protein
MPRYAANRKIPDSMKRTSMKKLTILAPLLASIFAGGIDEGRAADAVLGQETAKTKG